MNIIETPIADLLIIEPRIFKDSRGYFFESYNKNNFLSNELNYSFVQDNRSLSMFGTIRGLHFQEGNHAQAKLVEVIRGEVLDVAVDLRHESSTFGHSFSIHLSGDNKKQLLIPRGFAHGFSVLSKEALFSYKCDNIYHSPSENGIIYNDSSLKIDWKIPKSSELLSEKDLNLPSFNTFKESFQ